MLSPKQSHLSIPRAAIFSFSVTKNHIFDKMPNPRENTELYSQFLSGKKNKIKCESHQIDPSDAGRHLGIQGLKMLKAFLQNGTTHAAQGYATQSPLTVHPQKYQKYMLLLFQHYHLSQLDSLENLWCKCIQEIGIS